MRATSTSERDPERRRVRTPGTHPPDPAAPLPYREAVDNDRLAGRRMLVTGASSGIGAAIARRALERGAHVAGLARRADRLASIEGLLAAPADVTDSAAATAAVEAATGDLGGLDVLVNAAGINRPGLVADTGHDDWSAVFSTNVLGVLSVTKAAMPALRAGVEPSIVNISSNSGYRVVSPENGVYAASKSAVVALSDALRKELAGEVRVMDIAPGYVQDTEIHRDYDGPHRAEADERQRREGMAIEHFADLVLDLMAQPADVQVQSALVTRTGYDPAPYGT